MGQASNQNMDFLRIQSAGAIASSVLNRGVISASRHTCGVANHGFTDEHVKEDAFMVALQLHDYHGRLWVDGKEVGGFASKRGNCTFYDYTRDWRAELVSPFDCLNFHIPKSAFVALEEDLGTRPVSALNVRPGEDVDDPTVRSLADALLPALRNPANASRLFVDQVGLALSVHLATRYGELRGLGAAAGGVLAPWQLKRALALIDSKLDGDLSVAEIAASCRLSPSYFAKAFKQTTGITPHKWLLQRRVDRAMDLMRNTGLSLREIAADCGFTDQSHLTRVFLKTLGSAPASWRKSLRR